jgi:uncharacterized Zn-binding protein involved in type VI secretion
MPKPSNATAPATCGHSQTGSSKVFLEGMGASRVGVDTGGATITGPGSSKVFVEGSKLSLDGDDIADHGKNEHDAPTTTSTLSKVFSG